jgi:hypothetical protein
MDAPADPRHSCLTALSWGSDMPYSGLMPSIEAIQQAVREPLWQAPRGHQEFAIYIFERAREIDLARALAKKVAENGTATAPVSRPGLK